LTVRLNPYLSFRDNAREAMTFYQSVFGGELTVSTFADFHASADPTEQHKIMHSHPRAWSTGLRPVSPYRSAATTRRDCAATESA
jgi:uncharacterized glyoxalase superfamily protein PhnB